MSTTTLADQMVAFCEKILRTSHNDNQSTSTAFALLLGVATDSREFYSSLVSINEGLNKLIIEIESDEKFTPIKDFYLPYISGLPSYFTANYLHVQWSNVRSAFEKAHAPLKTFAAFQRAHNNVTGIDGNEVNSLLEELQELKEFTEKSNIPMELRIFVLTQISSLISTLSISNYVPVDALWDMTILAYGRVMRKKDDFEEDEIDENAPIDDEKNSIFTKLSNIASRALKLCDTVSKANDAVNAVESLGTKLLSVS